MKITNLSVGGASSEIGKTVLEYRLFSDAVKALMPHVVIWAHAANDAQEANKDMVFYEHMPGFIRAAHNLRLCDDDLPLVVLLEEFYGSMNYDSMNEIAGMLYKLSAWYGLMGISHANVIRHKLFANFNKPDFIVNVTGGRW